MEYILYNIKIIIYREVKIDINLFYFCEDGGPMFVREREHEVAHRQMLCRVLESLRYNGWEVMIAARLSRRVSSLIFK